MIRLRSFAATARQARRLRSFAATARQAAFAASLLRRDKPAFAASARQALMIAALVVIGGSSRLLACPTCFGAEETSMIDGTKLGIMVMLGITFTVQGAFLAFFLYLRRRAKRIADVELDTEWSELQRVSRTS